jgi:hypothetical protein
MKPSPRSLDRFYICFYCLFAVSRCSQLLLLTAFRENAAEGCWCVKGLQCGSPLALRTRDPPIIQVEIPTLPQLCLRYLAKQGTPGRHIFLFLDNFVNTLGKVIQGNDTQQVTVESKYIFTLFT